MRSELAKSIWKKINDADDKETEQMKAVLKKDMSEQFMNYYNIEYAKKELPNR